MANPFDRFDTASTNPFDGIKNQAPVKIGKDAFADTLREEMQNAGWLERNLAGAGTALSNLYEGAKQVLGGEGDKQRIQANRIMAEEAPVGAIAGNVAMFAPTVMIPGAATLRGAAAIGSAQGALEPVLDGESRLKNASIGAGLGASGVAAGRVVSGAYNGTKALVEPFTKRGQENIAARVMQRYAGSADDAARNISASGEIVPGSIPTLAEASKDAGLAQLQRDIANMNPQAAAALYERGLDNNAARLAALRSIAGDDAAMASAKAARTSASSPLYDQANNSFVPSDVALESLLNRPALKQAWDRAQRIAANADDAITLGKNAPAHSVPSGVLDANGNLLSTSVPAQFRDMSVKGLHYLKMGIDDLLTDPNSGIGKAEKQAILKAQQELLGWMDNASPAYGAARQAYAAGSRPINQMEVGQEILKKSTGAQLPNARGDMTLYPSQFGQAIKNGDALAKKQFSGNSGLGDVLEPEQIRTLIAIRDDLARQANAQGAGRAVGSNTAQNMAGQNILRQILGPMGMPQGIAESAFMQNIMRPIGFAYKGTEEPIQNALTQLILNPQRARDALQSASNAGGNMEWLKYLLPVTTGASAATQ